MRYFVDTDAAHDYCRQREIDREMFPDVTFTEATHEYRINDVVVPSVTQVIEPLRSEGGSESQREYKRQIGKALDSAIQILERGREIDPESLDPAVAPFVAAWLKFKKESGFRVLLNQPLVYSKKFRFAGTADVIGTRDPHSSTPSELIDTKCVWTMDAATAIQTAGYDLAARECFGLPRMKRGGVQLLRDGTYRYFPYSSTMDEQVFIACLSIFSWRRLHRA